MKVSKELINELKVKVNNMRPCIIKNPKDKLYYGIDRAMRWPVTEGCETEQDAIKAWRRFMFCMMGDTSTRRSQLNDV